MIDVKVLYDLFDHLNFKIKREIEKRRFEKEDMKTYLSFFCSGSNPVLIDDCFDFELRSPSLLHDDD